MTNFIYLREIGLTAVPPGRALIAELSMFSYSFLTFRLSKYNKLHFIRLLLKLF